MKVSVLSCVCSLAMVVFMTPGGLGPAHGQDAKAGGGATQAVAHRGLLRHAPENTLANFRACLELRLGFEFDVQRSKDGTLVCVHDDTLERTTNGKGRVGEHTLAELKKLDAGAWFHPRFAGERIPTIDEVLALLAVYRDTPVWAAVDLKGVETEADVVRLAKAHGVLEKLVFIGRTIDQPAVRKTIRTAAPTTHIACLAGTAADLPAALADVESDVAYLRFVPTAAEVSRCHMAGKRVLIAGKTVTGLERENWRLCREAGVDYVLTDYPLELVAPPNR